MPFDLRSLFARIPCSREQVTRIVWLMSAMAMGLTWRKGADYPRYAQWVQAFESSDILKIKSTVLSPVGVPVTHWSHAPALITDALSGVLGYLPFLEVGLPTVAWLVALAFWWSVIGLARLLAGGDVLFLLLVLAITFVGTHAGFYSTFYSSETFALATFAVATFWALSSDSARLRDSFIVGVAGSLLLIARVNLIMFLPLPLLTRAFMVWRAQGNRVTKAVVLHAAAVCLPLFVFGVQLLLFNYWMTGAPLKSAYAYGDDQFHSLDFAHPMFGPMLIHPWHGLLSYHPLAALGPVALAALALRRDLRVTERLWYGYALFAVFAQLYVQASWWCWWNGTGTFGNRTLALGPVIGAVALVRWLFLLKQSRTRSSLALAFVLLGLAAAACTWSFLLLLQGHSNHLTWARLLQVQSEVFQRFNVPLSVGALCALGFGMVEFRSLRSRAVFTAIAGFVAGLTAQALFSELVRDWATRRGIVHFTPALLGLVSALAFAAIVFLSTEREFKPTPARFARPTMAAALLWIFLAGTWGFAKLAISTRHVIADSTAQRDDYRYRSTMVLDDLIGTVDEYERIEGFEERKRAADKFVRHAAKAARRSD